jgi:riboflavin synthase
MKNKPMFTGIIQTTGKVKKLTESQIIVEAPQIADELVKGSSIAVDGACLTVVGLTEDSFFADFMPETLSKTVIGKYKIGHVVNLELPLTLNGRIEGHIVTGHVDSVGEISDITQDSNSYILTIKIPKKLDRQIVEKGSIAVNGISLTVISSKDSKFSVGIIPHTWKLTNLHALKKGDKVNIETDVLAKHIEKLM